MDAAEKLLKKTALFAVTTLLVLTAGVAQSQTLVANPNTVSISSGQGVAITINASDGSTVGFSLVSKPEWVSVTMDAPSTPNGRITLQINRGCSSFSPCANGNIVLRPSGGTGATDLSIPVTFSSGGGGGTSTLSANASTVPFSFANTGGSYTQSVTISTSSTTPITISTTTNPVSWLTCTLSNTQVSAGSPSTLYITANTSGFTNTTQNSNCTVTSTSSGSVSVGVSMAVGSTTTGSLQVSQNVVNFSYPCGNCTQSIYFTSAPISTFNLQVNSTNGWLNANGTTGFLSGQSVSGGIYLQVNTGVASTLPTNVYTGTVTIYNPNNSSDTTTITVYLSVNGGTGSGILSPSSLSFSANLNDAPKSSNVTVTSGTVTSASSNCSWVGVTQTTTANLFTITVIPSALFSANTYNCNVSFTVSGTVYTLPVTLFLGTSSGGGGTSGGVVAPTSLTFTSQSGAANAPSFQQVSVNGSGPITVSTTYGGGTQQFISATSNGTAPGAVYVYVTSGLGVGSYSGTLNVTVNGNTQQIPVTYNVTSGVAVIASPASINVTSENGGPVAPITLSLSASDNSNLPVTVQSSNSWVTVTSGTTASTPANFSVSINPVGLPNGLNLANLTVNATGAANNPMTIPVVVLVTGSSGGTGNLTLGNSTLSYNTTINGGNPASQFLTVNGPGGIATSFFVSASTSNCGGGWISVSPAGNLTTPQTLTVNVAAPTNVATSTQCTGAITLQSGGLTQTVQVVENIGSSGGGSSGNVNVSPTSLSFSYQAGSSSTPAAQALTVTSASGAAGVGFSINATTTSGGSWLSAGGTSSTTPTTLPISVNVSGLAAGTYQGNIAITPNGGAVINVPVTLTVQSLSVSASPTNLSFNYRAGDAAPQNQNITVTGVTGLTFTATASSNGNWLAVSPTSGTTASGGNTLQVSINPASLSAGDYNGTITVLGTGTATGSTTINVSLKVTAPLPTITKVTNAASYASGSLSAGEIITVFGTNIGPGTLVVLSQLESNGKVGTTLGGVQVLVGGYPAPLLYVRNDQIAAIVPYEIASPFLAGPNVVVKYLGQSSNGFPVNQVAAAPGIFTANQTGTGPGAILNGNSSPNSAGNPAAKGEIVQVFLTGEGQTSPAGSTGSVTPVTINTPKPLLSVAVLVDGQPANVTFFGEAPGLVAGVLQVNVQIPPNARSGDIPIQINMGGASTQLGVTVAVR